MFDRLWEILQACLELLVPFVVIFPYERGLLCRFGKFHHELETGFHWRIPLGVDKVFNDHITPRTTHLMGLSTTTKDGHSVGFDAVVTWKIADLRKATFEVTDLRDSLADTCAGQIGTALADSSWDDIRSGQVVENLTKICRNRGWRWGIEIMQVQLSGIALVRNYRVTGNTQHPVNSPVPGLQ